MKANQCLKVQCLLFALMIGTLLIVPASVAREGQQKKIPNFDESGRFWIYREGTDTLPFIPHGFMPEEAAIGKMIDQDLESTTVPPKNGELCWEVTIFHWNNSSWAGILSSTEDDWWGDDDSGLVYDLSDSNMIELEWWMRGQVGGEVVRVELGSLWDKKCGDVFKKDGVEIGKPIRGKWETLEPQWKRYTLSLDGFELSRLANGFTFVLEERRQSNATPLTFFIDDVALVRATENIAPVWTDGKPPEQIDITEGESVEIPIEATDLDSDALIYSKKVGPEWALFDAIVPVLTLSPPLGAIPQDATDQDFFVELEVTDGQVRVSKRLTVTVVQTSQITFSPVEETASPGQELKVGVLIDNVTNLAGFQVDLLFHPSVLEAIQVEKSNFLNDGNIEPFWQPGEIDNIQGIVTNVKATTFRAGGVTGTGMLLTITFKAKAGGESRLELQNLKIGNPLGESIPYQVIPGKVIVVSFPWDVNQDGTVDIFDLILVAQNFGQQPAQNPRADVKKDGTVDIFDLITVAQHFGETTNATAPTPLQMPAHLHAEFIERWLIQAYMANDGSEAFRRGIAVLERLLNTVIPEKTSILPNYPNPFNPETWIPYALMADSNARIFIYGSTGMLVRVLELGYKQAGYYTSKEKAAYWDGRNNTGEQVASGVYFYQLQSAGDFTATRKMLVVK